MSEDNHEQEEEPQAPIPREPFTREDLKNQTLLRNTEFRQELIDAVDKALLYQAAKRELRIIIDNYFTSNRFLTNLPDTKHGNGILASYNDLEHDMIYLIGACRPSDVRNPDFVGITNSIVTHFRPTALRAVGAKTRERILNPQTVFKQEQSIETLNNPMITTGQIPQLPKKKGFLSFLG